MRNTNEPERDKPIESAEVSGDDMSYGRAMTLLLIGLIAHTFTAP